MKKRLLATFASLALVVTACGAVEDEGDPTGSDPTDTEAPDDGTFTDEPDDELAGESDETDAGTDADSADSKEDTNDEAAADPDDDTSEDTATVREDGDDEHAATSAETDDADVEPLGSEATTGVSESEGEFGSDLAVTDVRVGTHDGFDRVTFEFAGDGQAGWHVNYQDGAASQGSGEPIEIFGDQVLSIALRNVTLPPELDDDIDAYDGPDRFEGPDGAQALFEIVEDTVFEGQHTWFLGTDGQPPYRIERFDDPQRVVIDLLHDDPDTGEPALSVEPDCATIGEGFTATATGLDPDREYTVMIEPRHSERAEPGTSGTADADGVLEVPATLPDDTQPGDYQLELSRHDDTLATTDLHIDHTCP